MSGTYLLNLSWISAKRIVISGSCSMCVSEFFARSRRALAFSLSISILFSKTPIWFSRSLFSSSSMLTMLWFLCLPMAHRKQIPLEQSLQKPLTSSLPWSRHLNTLLYCWLFWYYYPPAPPDASPLLLPDDPYPVEFIFGFINSILILTKNLLKNQF